MKLASETLGDDAIAAMTPKDVMIFTMHLMAKSGWWLKAAEIAEKVAKYVHPVLSSVDMNANVRRTTSDFSDDELVTLAASSYTEAEYAETTDTVMIADETSDDTDGTVIDTVTQLEAISGDPDC